MNDDVEKLLSRLSPRGTPPALRDRTLERVADVLAEAPVEEPSGATAGLPPAVLDSSHDDATRTRANFGTRLAWGVAALLLVGLTANLVAMRVGDARMAAFEPEKPEPPSREQLMIALAEPGGGGLDALDDGIAAARQSRRAADADDSLRRYRAILRKTISLSKESIHAVVETSPEVGVHRHRRPGGNCSSYQRILGMEHRRTA